MSVSEFENMEDDDLPQKYKWWWWLLKMIITVLTSLLTALGVSSCTPMVA